ncbi:AAA family ATPase [Verrucosispora sp. TAA-831]|uniref:AAA family ATPase n=1 Tax=Verrucosispora sp. TAA-831 TaxID=3422227 RepID=UPI003D6E72AB
MIVPELVVTRGLPASGKSTWAARWVAAASADRACVDRDSVRVMMHGRWIGTPEQEQQTSIVCHGAVLGLLRAGISVVAGDTNLDEAPDGHLTALWDIADRTRSSFRVVDFTAVPLEVCIERDAARTGPDRVGADKIRDMWEQHLQGRPSPLPLPPLVRGIVEVPAELLTLG